MNDDERRATWARLCPTTPRKLTEADLPPPIVPTAEYCARLDEMASHYTLRQLLDGDWRRSR